MHGRIETLRADHRRVNGLPMRAATSPREPATASGRTAGEVTRIRAALRLVRRRADGADGRCACPRPLERSCARATAADHARRTCCLLTICSPHDDLRTGRRRASGWRALLPSTPRLHVDVPEAPENPHVRSSSELGAWLGAHALVLRALADRCADIHVGNCPTDFAPGAGAETRIGRTGLRVPMTTRAIAAAVAA